MYKPDFEVDLKVEEDQVQVRVNVRHCNGAGAAGANRRIIVPYAAGNRRVNIPDDGAALHITCYSTNPVLNKLMINQLDLADHIQMAVLAREVEQSIRTTACCRPGVIRKRTTGNDHLVLGFGDGAKRRTVRYDDELQAFGNDVEDAWRGVHQEIEEDKGSSTSSDSEIDEDII